MSPKFEAVIQQLDDLTYVKLVGVLDEDNELAPLVHRVRGRTVVIDLAGIEDINNCGVRDWVNCLDKLHAREITIVLVECSPAIVAKLNSVSNFFENGFIKDFYVPYYCQACEMEKALLVDLNELREVGHKTPTCRCDRCDGIMAFDDLEESYFRFIKDAKKGGIPDSVQRLMDQLSPRRGERKIISRLSKGRSSFAGIPSTTSSQGEVSSVSSVIPPSIASLRRLQGKTSLSTVQPATSPRKEVHQSRRRWWVMILGFGLLFASAALMLFWGYG